MRRFLTSLTIAGALALGSVVAVAAPAEAAGHNSCRSYVLRQGSVGYCTRMAQTLLRGPYNYSNGPFTYTLKLDGDFGAKTKAATVKWQRNYRLKVDGVIGAQTWRSLCSWGAGSDGPPPAYHRVYQAAYDATC